MTYSLCTQQVNGTPVDAGDHAHLPTVERAYGIGRHRHDTAGTEPTAAALRERRGWFLALESTGDEA